MRPPGIWTLRLAVAVVALAVAWFDVWTVRSNGEPWKFGQEQRDYYNLLIDGWLDGHLWLKVDVPPALLQLPDPYDPTLRPPGLALHDASFFHGKYYLYFGAGPVVTLMLPFRLLTGTDLPLPVAVLVFVYGGFLAALATFLAVRRRHFPDTGLLPALLCTLALGLAGLGPVLLRRTQVWELPIAAGFCFAMLALYGAFRSLHSTHRAVPWLAATSLCLGLAIASRPTYLVALPLLAAPALWIWRQQRGGPGKPKRGSQETSNAVAAEVTRRDGSPTASLLTSAATLKGIVPARAGVHRLTASPARVRLAAAAILPLAVIGSLMAWHNHARFGDPLQFGQSYQFSLDYEAKMQHFSPRYVAFNAWRYFGSPAQWTRYFPFIRPAELPPKPPGFGGHDDVYGVLTNLPLAWFAFAAPLALWRRPRQERARFAGWLAAATILFGAVAALLLCFFGSLARYQLEFTPTLILLGCVGLLSLERLVRSWRIEYAPTVARLAFTAVALFSAGFAVLFSLQLNRLLAERNPAGERGVARILNRVPAWFERVAGAAPAARELEVRFPARPAANRETLLSVGDAPDIDRVFVRYAADGAVQLGFSRAGMPEVTGSPRQLDRAVTHRVRIVLGALLPPPEHPWFEGVPADAARRASRILRLELDGETVAATFRRFDATAGGRVRIGGGSLGDKTYPRFSGDVITTRRIALRPADLAVPDGRAATSTGDTFRMKLKFPASPGGATEPLVVTGATGQGDLLGVQYLGANHLRFVFDHWGSRLLTSEPLTIDFTAEHELTVQFTWLVLPATRIESRGQLRLTFDGREVWQETTMGYHADPEEIALGENPIGGSNCGLTFTGRIIAANRL